MIELNHISKDFGNGQRQVHAVRDVSLSIEKGEIFGIIGFSGAGKSTLARCVNLLERPTEGRVIVGGSELIDGNPLGGLVVVAGGGHDKIAAAAEYLSKRNVQVEVISHG